MRAWEFLDLIQYDRGVGVAGSDDSRKPRLTLRYLNHMKQQRKRRAAEFAKKRPLMVAMYGEPGQQAERFETELQREEERHDIEMLKQGNRAVEGSDRRSDRCR